MRKLIQAAILVAVLASSARAADPPSTAHQLQIPTEIRQWYRNPDGSCVQCSIGMCGIAQNVPEAYTLLWDTDYGTKVRGGSYPSRVEAYSDRRGIKIYNITGSETFDWMKWACKTGRFAAIGAGTRHFQTLYGWDEATDRWYVCNNNSPHRVDTYSSSEFRRLHLASGQWVVILDYPPGARAPIYIPWWE